MMQDQLEKSRAETQGIREMKGKVEGIIEGLSLDLKKVDVVNGEVEKKSESVEEGREVWEELEREFGAV